MAHVNEHYLNLSAGYLFPEIARRVADFLDQHPDAPLIKMGIGDVTEPLPQAAVRAMHDAVDEMGRRETFHGYGPGQGYPFLRTAIADNEYAARGCDISSDEIFVSDGSKCDCANILDIFGPSKVAVCDPVYPVYVDTNIMAGNGGPVGDGGRYEGLIYLDATAENGFQPSLPTEPVDLVYLCFPNNPTGAVADRATLQAWVDWCHVNDAVLLFDAAYEAFIQTPDIPHSIYELDGARECAIEFRSFSKTAGFTGVRAAWTVVPTSLQAKNKDREPVSLHKLWARRQSTKFNGISYIVSRGCESIFTPDGKRQVADLVTHYLGNARLLREALTEQGVKVFGGVDAPYVWLKNPAGVTSWAMFDRLLEDAHLVSTPGSGFGQAGEGYVRLSAFNSRENVAEAVDRLQKMLIAE